MRFRPLDIIYLIILSQASNTSGGAGFGGSEGCYRGQLQARTAKVTAQRERRRPFVGPCTMSLHDHQRVLLLRERSPTINPVHFALVADIVVSLFMFLPG